MKKAEKWCEKFDWWADYMLQDVRSVQADALRHAAEVCRQRLPNYHVPVYDQLIEEAEKLEAK